MDVTGIYSGLRNAYKLINNKKSAVDLNKNGTIDEGEQLRDVSDVKPFLKVLVKNENDLTLLHEVFSAININNDKSDPDINTFESKLVARACLIASGTPEKEINHYLAVLDDLFSGYVVCQKESDRSDRGKCSPGVTSRESPDSCLKGYLWSFKNNRYDYNCFKLNEVIDNQIKYFKSGGNNTVGNCLGLTTLFTILALRTGVNIKAVTVPGHIFSKINDNNDIENTNWVGYFSNPAYPVRNESNVFICVFEIFKSRTYQYLGKGDWDKSIECGKRALALNPNDSSLYVIIAAAYKHSGKYQSAIACCEKAAAIDPKYPDTYSEMSAIYSKMHMEEKAKEYWDKFLKL